MTNSASIPAMDDIELERLAHRYYIFKQTANLEAQTELVKAQASQFAAGSKLLEARARFWRSTARAVWLFGSAAAFFLILYAVKGA